jgi:hypothetical protein
MGSADFYPEERPVRRVDVDPFWIDEHPVTVVVVPAGRPMAPPGRAAKHPQRPGAASGHPCRLRGRGGLRRMGRQGTAHRGRMGVRGPRRPRRRGLLLGRRVRTQGPDDGQHLAGRVPVAEPAAGPLRAHIAGWRLPTQRVRPFRHDRQRLGVDRGRLPRPRQPGVLRARRVGCRYPARHQGRFTPVRAELLPALPPRGTASRDGRHLDLTPGPPLRHPGSLEINMRFGHRPCVRSGGGGGMGRLTHPG